MSNRNNTRPFRLAHYQTHSPEGQIIPFLDAILREIALVSNKCRNASIWNGLPQAKSTDYQAFLFMTRNRAVFKRTPLL